MTDNKSCISAVTRPSAAEFKCFDSKFRFQIPDLTYVENQKEKDDNVMFDPCHKLLMTNFTVYALIFHNLLHLSSFYLFTTTLCF